MEFVSLYEMCDKTATAELDRISWIAKSDPRSMSALRLIVDELRV